MTQIKICGITCKEEIGYLNEFNIDYAGFVLYPKSKRYISVSEASMLFDAMNDNIKKVAVVVSPDADMIRGLNESSFDIYQIHKLTNLDVLKEAKKPVWLAVNVVQIDEVERVIDELDKADESIKSRVEAIVVDSSNFGSGQTFDWKKSRRLKKAGSQSPPGYRYVLAGGLNDENVQKGIELFETDIVDVSSSVEGTIKKDREKIKRFAEKVRKADERKVGSNYEQ